MTGLGLRVLDGAYAVVQFNPGGALPVWAKPAGELHAVVRTPSECSVVVEASAVPADADAPVERPWRALMVEGPLDFSMVGVLTALAQPLAEAGVSIFVISTYDTDILLVKSDMLEEAVRVLTGAGHRCVGWPEHSDA